jgi:hypothetical protein
MSEQATVTTTGTWAACLKRLATALSGYPDLAATVRADGAAPCLAVRNTAASLMSETVTVRAQGDGLAFTWSWGVRICDASDPDTAAAAVAYVLAAQGAELRPGGRTVRRPADGQA